MIDFLVGKSGLIMGGVLAIFTILATMIGFARKAGKDAEKVEEAKARAENIERLKRAVNAEPSGDVRDDPNNLDR